MLLADGTSKPIEEVQPGDRVVATDPETGQTRLETVAATIVGTGTKLLVDVTIAASDGDEADPVVTATDRHPFWDPFLREWIPAINLKAGQWLRTSAGTSAQVTAIDHRLEPATVHNLTVTDTHTYHVLAGNTPVLVHNSGPCDGDEIGVQHAIDRHTRGGSAVTPNSGIFDEGVDLPGLARSTAGQIGIRQENGNIVYVLRSPAIVGTDGITGLPTNVYTVVRNPWGELVTLHPGR